jgi:branched-chain amino acid transport system permease protein
MTGFLGFLIDGVMYAAWLFLIAVGLTLIFGVMRILNMAHGTFYAIGAYAAATAASAWIAREMAPLVVYPVLIVAGIAAGVILGVVVERGLLRFMRGRDATILLLVTYALFLILEDAIKLIWGVDPYLVSEPYGMLGNFSIGLLSYPNYNLIVLFAAVFSGLALTYFLQSTRKGKMLRAVIHDADMSQAIGIDVDRWFLVTFVAGTVLACVGGALVAPTISVVPGMGVEVIVLMFAVVVIGGLGSIPGAALGALLVGFVRAAAVHYWPEAELFSIYGAMALVLVVRPKGLFAAPEPRKI